MPVLQVFSELQAIVNELQLHHPRLLADTLAMAEALESLTVTPQEKWASLLGEMELDVSRKLLALQADAARLAGSATVDQQQRAELLGSR